MKDFVKCKACNYIMEKEKLKDVCPACGVPEKLFEDYKYNISFKRYFIMMELDLHPILLHFPQAISVFIPFFIILSVILDASMGIKLLYSAEIMAYLFPFTVAAAYITGLFDAKNRFKKLTNPALKTKIIYGAVLFMVSLVIPVLVLSMGIKESAMYIAALSVVCIALQVILARIGIKLMFAFLPGN
jgi:rubredoxin